MVSGVSVQVSDSDGRKQSTPSALCPLYLPDTRNLTPICKLLAAVVMENKGFDGNRKYLTGHQRFANIDPITLFQI